MNGKYILELFYARCKNSIKMERINSKLSGKDS
jgi:hypothetical protein